MKKGNLLECRDLLLAARRDAWHEVYGNGIPSDTVKEAWLQFRIGIDTAVWRLEELDKKYAEKSAKNREA